jgi:hypothetical protein
VAQETVMSLLAESCARKADADGDQAKAAEYRRRAQGYRYTPRASKPPQQPAQPRQRAPRPTPGRYMTEAQARYLHDLIASRPPAEQALLYAALNAEWVARTLTVGRASSWISHLLQTPSVMVSQQLISSGC